MCYTFCCQYQYRAWFNMRFSRFLNPPPPRISFRTKSPESAAKRRHMVIIGKFRVARQAWIKSRDVSLSLSHLPLVGHWHAAGRLVLREWEALLRTVEVESEMDTRFLEKADWPRTAHHIRRQFAQV